MPHVPPHDEGVDRPGRAPQRLEQGGSRRRSIGPPRAPTPRSVNGWQRPAVDGGSA